MNIDAEPRDLIVLAADKHIAASVETLLRQRPADMGIRTVSPDVLSHPRNDPGCRTDAAEFLRSFNRRYRYALVVFDRWGCGSEKTAEDIQKEVENALGRNGWKERSKAIVIAPELEAWVWSPSVRVAQVLGWGHSFEALRKWLGDEGLWPQGHLKPPDPKKAAEQALRQKRKVRSSAVFRDLATSVDFNICRDPAFNEFRETLQAWFPMKAAP